MNKVKTFMAAALVAAASMSAHAASADAPGFWTTPTIQGYGKIHYLPNSTFKPQPGHTYKVVFALTQGVKEPSKVNPALDHVARTVNLYVAAGVPVAKLKFVAVAYGAATPLALSDPQYRAAYGVPNPNLPLIAELKKAGVTVSVCGQAAAEHHFEYDWIDTNVTLALSGLTTVTTLEQQGYVLMPL
ncbi:DsrE family protein [Paraburkholderia sp. FT54]|uniref:DsrE family protein n=1 Tax=Paraburkholderia sp. FT54 TaxID=3074437 RepID=UPI0028779CB8|nr:DsrE family protein [Paraburkholderia sp. FT54]WNC89126.1 DsrE family protein [Paraburkholderia sp. FT54]